MKLTNVIEIRETGYKRRLAQWQIQWLIEHFNWLQLFGVLTVLYFKMATFG
jgi:hypothetical protein